MNDTQTNACPVEARRTLLELLENVIAAQFEAEIIRKSVEVIWSACRQQ